MRQNDKFILKSAKYVRLHDSEIRMQRAVDMILKHLVVAETKIDRNEILSTDNKLPDKNISRSWQNIIDNVKIGGIGMYKAFLSQYWRWNHHF